jgi:hypothetical protein
MEKLSCMVQFLPEFEVAEFFERHPELVCFELARDAAQVERVYLVKVMIHALGRFPDKAAQATRFFVAGLDNDNLENLMLLHAHGADFSSSSRRAVLLRNAVTGKRNSKEAFCFILKQGYSLNAAEWETLLMDRFRPNAIGILSCLTFGEHGGIVDITTKPENIAFVLRLIAWSHPLVAIRTSRDSTLPREKYEHYLRPMPFWSPENHFHVPGMVRRVVRIVLLTRARVANGTARSDVARTLAALPALTLHCLFNAFYFAYNPIEVHPDQRTAPYRYRRHNWGDRAVLS